MTNVEDPIAELTMTADASEPGDKRREKRAEKKQADEAADAMRDVGDLWHDTDGEAWMSFTSDDHREHWPLRSKAIRSLMSLTYYRKTGSTLGSQGRQDALARLEGSALFEGEEHIVYTRIAGVDKVIWIDLADDAWRAIRITSAGWCLVDKPPVRFRRRRGMRPLPEPITGGSVNALRSFINVAGNDDWIMIVAFVVAALRDAGPYPVLELTGEAGSAKSTACRVVRSLIDPSSSPLRSEPREVRDLMIAARNCWVIALDNISHLPPWLSDAICRLATGGGFATRELYSDDAEVIFEAMRPVILNGIEGLADRGDLAARSIVIALSQITEGRRRDESTFWAEFEDARPAILGGLFDAVSGALRRLPDTRLSRLPRMADFARWVVAAAPDLGFTGQEFLTAYSLNRAAANEVTLESSPIAAFIIELADRDPTAGWTGTATELLRHLEGKADENAQRRRDFPHSTKALHGALVRLAPHLRAMEADGSPGIEIDFDQRGQGRKRARLIVIRRESETSVQPVQPSDNGSADLEPADRSRPDADRSTPHADRYAVAARIQADGSDTSDRSVPLSSKTDADGGDLF